MKPTDAERDPAFDRLIARGLDGETDVSGHACPDADLLAAWFDRSLSASEVERIETHASSSGLCQQILADLARSEPEVVRAAPVPNSARPWHWHWRWLVPVATALVVVVVAGSRTLRAPQPLTMAARQPAAETAAAPPARSPVALPPAAASSLEPAQAPAEAAKGAADRTDEAAPRRAASAEVERKDQVARVEPGLPTAASGGGVRLEPTAATPQAPPAAPPVTFQARTADALAGAAPAQAAPKPDAALGQAANAAAGAAAQESATRLMTQVAMKAESRAAIPSVAVGPGGKIAWRVGAEGRIERSIDGRASWQAQASGVASHLTAASAPSDTVCWAVGLSGTVLRTIDGRTWQLLAPPTQLDLLGVAATSQDAATVKATDGSEYVTTDGGRTWTRRAGRD